MALSFYPLTFVEDAPDVIIGRKDVNTYAAFPADGAELLRRLETKSTLEEVAQWYEERYGEPVDLADFLKTLDELQFIRAADEKEAAEVPMSPVQIRSAQLWVGQAAFSPIAWLLYMGIIGYTLFLLLRFPYLWPVSRHLFFSPSLVLVELGLFVGQFPGILLHEFYHILAGWRLGLPARLSVGRRLTFLVFETHLDGLWSVPRRLHYLPLLAGMLGDLLWFSGLTILASLSYTQVHPSAFPGAFCLSLAFSTVLRLLWQFSFYLETDIYYIFSYMLRCVDLQQTTRHYLWNCIYRLLGHTERIQDPEQWHPRDKQVARWYVFFFGAGYLFTLGTVLLVGVPTALRIFSEIFTHLVTHAKLDAGFWDTSIFLLFNSLQFAIVFTLFLRDFLTRKRASRSAGVANEHGM